MILSPYQAGVKLSADRTHIVRPQKRSKVAIIGFGDKEKRQAPYDDPEWEIWGLNMANRLGLMHDSDGLFRCDVWFDLHQLLAQSKQDMDWIHDCPVPIYLTEPCKESKNGIVYPLEKIQEHFDGLGGDYFASSFAYMTALAIYEQYDTIGFFGCNLDYGRERVVEHGNLAYWIGLARGLGHEVLIPDDSLLCRHPALYGFDYYEESLAVDNKMAVLIMELLENKKVAAKFKILQEKKILDDLARNLKALKP